MDYDSRPYAKYGVVKLLMVLDIRKKVEEISLWNDIKELTNVVLACADFENAWRMQEESLTFDEAIRIMDEAWEKLDDKALFVLMHILQKD